MVNRSKAKGTDWENACVAVLRENGAPYAERRVIAGKLDRGDIAGVPRVVIECKNEARIDLPGYLAEAEREKYADDFALVWIKKRGKTGAEHGYIVMTPMSALALLRKAGYLGEPNDAGH